LHGYRCAVEHSMLFYLLFRSIEILDTPAGFTLMFLTIGPVMG
jgi:hypothetical protein